MSTVIAIKPLFVDIEDAAIIVGLSVSTVQSNIRNNDFPKARKTSRGTARYLVRELEEWAESRPIADFLPPPETAKGGRNSKRQKSAECV